MKNYDTRPSSKKCLSMVSGLKIFKVILKTRIRVEKQSSSRMDWASGH